MDTVRYDEHASIADAPTALPSVFAPQAHVCRGMNDLSEAGMYARDLARWFAQNGAPTEVYVVRGPTSTTRLGYEVVTATCGYTAAFKAAPPYAEELAASHLTPVAGRTELTDVEREIIIDTYRSRHMQEHLHAACLHNVLTAVDREKVASDLARCQAFLERRVACIYAHERGENTSEKMWQRLLAEWWPDERHDALLELLKGYIEHGYLKLNEPIKRQRNSPNPPLTPLEAVIRSGYTRIMSALLDAGADETLVPAEPVVRIQDGPILAKQGELLAFIESQTHTDVDGMLAAAREALMRRAISGRAPQHASAERPARRLREV